MVGFGLCAAENEPGPFQAAFRIAKEGGLLCVPHQGELLGPATIKQAMQLLQVDRIGHGISAVSSEETIKMLKDKNVFPPHDLHD